MRWLVRALDCTANSPSGENRSKCAAHRRLLSANWCCKKRRWYLSCVIYRLRSIWLTWFWFCQSLFRASPFWPSCFDAGALRCRPDHISILSSSIWQNSPVLRQLESSQVRWLICCVWWSCRGRIRETASNARLSAMRRDRLRWNFRLNCRTIRTHGRCSDSMRSFP